jgi:hypothetical protein
MPRRMAILIVLENMMLQSPFGLFGVTRAAQQESIEGAVQDTVLYRA